jgi:outer membrane protein assembly factor BamD
MHCSPSALSNSKTLTLKLRLLATGFILISVGLSGCSTTADDRDETSKWSAEKLHKEGKEALASADYETAIEMFEILEAKYPFGQFAEQAQLDTAYAYYKFEEPDSAISAADRFIKLHPRHNHVDYAYYLRGLASESKKINVLDSVLPQDASLRDPASTQKAHDYFAELVKKFPNSIYAPDAAIRMGHLRNSVAAHEIHVANYYLDRGACVAAVNRAKHVVENFPQTPASRQALEILVDCYTQMGMTALVKDVQRIQQLNPTPGSTSSSAKKESSSDS